MSGQKGRGLPLKSVDTGTGISVAHVTLYRTMCPRPAWCHTVQRNEAKSGTGHGAVIVVRLRGRV